MVYAVVSGATYCILAKLRVSRDDWLSDVNNIKTQRNSIALTLFGTTGLSEFKDSRLYNPWGSGELWPQRPLRDGLTTGQSNDWNTGSWPQATLWAASAHFGNEQQPPNRIPVRGKRMHEWVHYTIETHAAGRLQDQRRRGAPTAQGLLRAGWVPGDQERRGRPHPRPASGGPCSSRDHRDHRPSCGGGWERGASVLRTAQEQRRGAENVPSHVLVLVTCSQ